MESADAQPSTGLQELAETFISMIPSLKLYTEYVNKFSTAVQTLSTCMGRNSAIQKLVKVH